MVRARDKWGTISRNPWEKEVRKISFRETPEMMMMMMRGSDADYLTLGQLLLHL